MGVADGLDKQARYLGETRQSSISTASNMVFRVLRCAETGRNSDTCWSPGLGEGGLCTEAIGVIFQCKASIIGIRDLPRKRKT